jgi:hypothetical protein
MGKIAKWREFSEEEFAQKVKEAKSFKGLAESLGYAQTGGSVIETMHKAVEERNLDTSHFLG